MAETNTPNPLLSIDEYLALERDGAIRHEYVDGRLYPMTGGSSRHNRITLNIASRALSEARGSRCRVYMSDMKVQTPGGAAYYPDVMVVCAPESDDPYTEYEPCLLVEVKSPTNRINDEREKLVAYQTIPSLQAYLIIEQDRRHVERHFRNERGDWLRTTLIGDSTVPIPCPETELALADIYEGL